MEDVKPTLWELMERARDTLVERAAPPWSMFLIVNPEDENVAEMRRLAGLSMRFVDARTGLEIPLEGDA